MATDLYDCVRLVGAGSFPVVALYSTAAAAIPESATSRTSHRSLNDLRSDSERGEMI
jgi:hypothetical protein